jgi:hypothetical protein
MLDKARSILYSDRTLFVAKYLRALALSNASDLPLSYEFLAIP